MAKRKKNTSKQQLNGQTMKRKKTKLQLSYLPEDILCSIMSKLPLKEAARMSNLSSQLNLVWCCRTSLIFSFESLMSRRYAGVYWTYEDQKLVDEEFISRANSILQKHNGAGIEKIKFRYDLENPFAYDIDRWLNFESRTKQLVRDFRSTCPIDEPYSFPFQLLDGTNHTNLRYLTLGSVHVKQPVDFKGFLSLTTLKLFDVRITDEDLQHLLSTCNVLQFFGVSECQMITRLRITHPSNQLKHLQANNKIHRIEETELNPGLTTLEYCGPLIPFAIPDTLLLTNLCMKSWFICGTLQYIFTKLPSTLPRLQKLTLKCRELERIPLPDKRLKFVYLKHLSLELTFSDTRKRKTNVLDFAYILEAAPFMEKLEFHMWMNCDYRRYRKGDGELRTPPPCPHRHLKVVHITGFYGQKDQLELALHILRNSAVLEAMEIEPKPLVVAANAKELMALNEEFYFVDGSRVAMKYLRKADHCNVVHVSEGFPKDVENVGARKLVSPFGIKFRSFQKFILSLFSAMDLESSLIILFAYGEELDSSPSCVSSIM